MKYGLIGEKLGHSFSKAIHERIGDYTYELREIEKTQLDAFMKEKDFVGINVTIPYKTAVMPYLDYIDVTAEKIGAVNTVVNRDGKLYGYNTDFGGLKMLVERSGFDYRGKKILILGTGGTSKTANAVAKALGAREVIHVSRRESKGFCGVDYENVYSIHSDADYIINTTPLGMYPNNEGCAVDVSRFASLSGVTDVVYNPLSTTLCQKSQAVGVKAESGLYMLVCQAVIAAEIFTGKNLDRVKLAEEIFRELRSDKENIVLIGMPGSGKTTIGKALAEATGKTFIDTDEMIVSEYGVISDIFAEKGEEYFRDIEAEKVKEAAKMNGMIIATGGGAVLREGNVTALRQNGKLFFLDRPLSDIIPTQDRPLSRDESALKKRFEERYDIYCAAADEVIAVDGVVEHSVIKITEKMR